MFLRRCPLRRLNERWIRNVTHGTTLELMSTIPVDSVSKGDPATDREQQPRIRRRTRNINGKPRSLGPGRHMPSLTILFFLGLQVVSKNTNAFLLVRQHAMFLALQPFRPKIITDNAITSGQTGCSNMVSGGFSFSDGEQILVSAQKPLGMVLEQDTATGAIVVAEVDPSGPASRGGVRAGDVLVAVQNASTEKVDLDSVLDFIGNGPRVMNLRFIRGSAESSTGIADGDMLDA